MATKPAVDRTQAGVVEAQFARVANAGSARHPQLAALLAASGPNAARDLADAVHLLCNLYGRHPGLIDLALRACAAGASRDWLKDAAESFERERLYLVRLTTALVEDWRALRRLLDRAADRAGLDVPGCTLPDEGSVALAIQAGADTPGAERALAFGSEQLLLQHRGLFDLLEARAEARDRFD